MPADDRFTIRAVGAAATDEDQQARALKSMWHKCDLDTAISKLKQDDVKVTNQRDKSEQLAKLQTLPDRVARIVSGTSAEIELTVREGGAGFEVEMAAREGFMATWVARA